MLKKFMAILLTSLIFISAITFSVAAESVTEAKLSEIANGIILWKKSDNNAEPDSPLINEKYLELAGTTPGDWYQIGLSRLEIEDNFDGYLAVIKDKIEERYAESGALSAAKATEWHRISLAVLASGGDPTAIGKDKNGKSIDLIADGTYNRGKTTSLGRQGINGWIWGLIAIDSMRYSVPEDAFYTRDDIITEIISRKLPDGGFTLGGSTADPDITAMAIQSLAPYYNSEKVYTYTEKQSGKKVTKAVFEVVDEALECLSKLQLDTGDFASWGTQNVESTDQVAVALCNLGINPLEDKRFIKNGNTLLDGILRYRMKDGGFVHSFTYDEDNPTSLPDSSNTMASEQTLYTIAAIWRQLKGKRTLYDFRNEQSSALKNRISELEIKISAVKNTTSKTEIESLLKEFYSIPEDERSYVFNYRILSNAAKSKNIDIFKIAEETEVVESPKDNADTYSGLIFSDSDRKAVDSLPNTLTGEYYVRVVTLLDKLNRSNDFKGKAEYLKKLESARNKISAITDEVDRLNAEIREKLYPFDKISLKDKKTVYKIIERYNKLSDFDKGKIERSEDLIKTKTKIDNILRGIIISTVLCLTATLIAFFFIRRTVKKRRKKELEMQELALLYSDDE